MGGAAQGSGDAKHRWNGCGGRSRGGLTTKIHALVRVELQFELLRFGEKRTRGDLRGPASPKQHRTSPD
jgi:hypothetical protein